MLCEKKIGLFKSYGEDILTGDPTRKICEDCFSAVDLLMKKAEMKIPFKPDDTARFSEAGTALVLEYIRDTEDFIDEIEFDEMSADDPMKKDIGEAIIDRTFEIDDEETENIFKEIKAMPEEKICDFLDPLVSEHDAADSFMREIKALNNEELASVIADQREYYNNAEWAYILYVDDFRKFITQKSEETSSKKIPVDEQLPEEIDENEIKRMEEVFRNYEKTELEEVLTDGGYTYEARTAAKNLLRKFGD